MGSLERNEEARAAKRSHGDNTSRPAVQRQSSRPPKDRPRRKRDPDAVPDGFDANVWHLAVFFEKAAETRGFELATGRPVIYHRLAQRIDRSPLKDHGGADLIEIVEEMITVFWDDEVWLNNTRYALDQFSGVETFIRLAEWAIEKRRPTRTGEKRYCITGPSEAGERRRAKIRERQELLTSEDAWARTMERVRGFVERHSQ